MSEQNEHKPASIVITGRQNIEMAIVLATAHALALEINTGMVNSHGSVLNAARERGLTTKRTKKGALRDVIAHIKKAWPEYEPSASIERALG